jgi:hypothetical protein
MVADLISRATQTGPALRRAPPRHDPIMDFAARALRRWLGRAALVVLCLSVPAGAEACTCDPGPNPPCRAAWYADAVFTATVLDVIDLPQPVAQAFQPRLARLRLQESFSGDFPAEIDVATGRGGGDCGYPFSKGREYLVYAHRNPVTGRLTTSICSRTTLMLARQDLPYLRGPSRPTDALGSIRGTATLFDLRPDGRVDRRPFAGARIIATSADRTVEATTDVDGKYELSAPIGRYDIRVEVPAGVVARPASPGVQMVAGRCSGTDIRIEWDGRISGRLVDSRGAPVTGLAIELIAPSGVHVRESITRTDGLGRYEFSALPPAAFQIGVSLPQQLGGSDDARVVFAGADGSPLAIAVGRGAQAADVDLVLPGRVETATLTGIVLSPDGAPQAGARVHVTADAPRRPSTGPPAVIAGADGRFALSVVSGRYRVIAEGYRDGRLVSYSDALIVDTLPAAVPATLRLQPLRPPGLR